jgi:hypothetical protein
MHHLVFAVIFGMLLFNVPTGILLLVLALAFTAFNTTLSRPKRLTGPVPKGDNP